jgi:hypothetical protein
MPRYSRKYKRGGRPPNTSTSDARGNSNGQPVEYSEREISDRENNIMDPDAMSMELEIGEVDPRSVGITPEQSIEYERQLEEGNLSAYRKKYGRQGDFTRIYDEDDEDKDDDEYHSHEGGRKRRKTTKRRKTSKKRKTTKRRKPSKKRRSSKKR